MTRADEETRAIQFRADQVELEAQREERLNMLAGDEAQAATLLENWKPVILANAERDE